jgi:hypothetical protein
MAKLNRIKVAKAGEMTNVCLAWEGVNELRGEKVLLRTFESIGHSNTAHHAIRPAFSNIFKS